MENNFPAIKKLEDFYQLNTYKKLPIALVRGNGVRVYDSEGRSYLDLYGGHAVAVTGHCHPEMVRAVKSQVENLIFYSNVVYSEIRARASEAVVNVAPAEMDKVFFCNSGAEANETAMKIARKFSGKPVIVAMKNGFHGRTTAALGATGLGSYRKQFSPVYDAYRFAEFGNIDDFESSLSDDVGAVILEPIQSMAGVEMADEGYYRELREICTERGIVLIFDEVQTGMGRTGSWFFGDSIGVVPDIISLAKGLGGGIPVGAVIISEEISKTIKPGEHGSTFGGGPVASAAILANIKIIKEENLVRNASDVGNYIKERLSEIPLVRNVKGKGLLLGIELDEEAVKVRDFLLKRGIITGTSVNKNVLRLLPPLVLKRQDLGIFFDALNEYTG